MRVILFVGKNWKHRHQNVASLSEFCDRCGGVSQMLQRVTCPDTVRVYCRVTNIILSKVNRGPPLRRFMDCRRTNIAPGNRNTLKAGSKYRRAITKGTPIIDQGTVYYVIRECPLPGYQYMKRLLSKDYGLDVATHSAPVARREPRIKLCVCSNVVYGFHARATHPVNPDPVRLIQS